MGCILNSLVEGSEIQRRIDLLDNMLSTAVRHGHKRAREWLEGEIMQLEAEQLAMLQQEVQNEKSRPGRQLNSVAINNLIIPSVPQWRGAGQ